MNCSADYFYGLTRWKSINFPFLPIAYKRKDFILHNTIKIEGLPYGLKDDICHFNRFSVRLPLPSTKFLANEKDFAPDGFFQ